MIFDVTDALWGLAGGLMIGTAAALLLLMNGRISGVSGVLEALLQPNRSRQYMETIAFVVGIIAAPLIYWAVHDVPEVEVTGNVLLLIGGGLLVGLGARLGNGCTSGHGVCGMSRFSMRSIASTMIFMVIAILVASIVVPLFGV